MDKLTRVFARNILRTMDRVLTSRLRVLAGLASLPLTTTGPLNPRIVCWTMSVTSRGCSIFVFSLFLRAPSGVRSLRTCLIAQVSSSAGITCDCPTAPTANSISRSFRPAGFLPGLLRHTHTDLFCLGYVAPFRAVSTYQVG
jgi:hypothetical protein